MDPVSHNPTLGFALTRKLISGQSPTNDTIDFFTRAGWCSLLLTFISLNFLSYSISSKWFRKFLFVQKKTKKKNKKQLLNNTFYISDSANFDML